MKGIRSIDEVTAIAEKLAESLGYELVEAAFEKEPTGVYLRLYIDTAGGITLDDCEKYHMAIQPKVEKFEYDFLEMCSPGADRPIKTARDAEKAKGKMAEARLYKPLNGQKTVSGVFLGMDENGYRLLQNGTEIVLKQKDVAIIRCQVDLSALDENIEIEDVQEESQP